MRHVTIPRHWTGEEALTTVAFLEEIIRAIWRAHGDEMGEVMLGDHDQTSASEFESDFPLDEDLPF
jgi:hypothetical protein